MIEFLAISMLFILTLLLTIKEDDEPNPLRFAPCGVRGDTLLECSKVSVMPSLIGGNGVFAKVGLKQGETIEKGLMIPLVNVDPEIGHYNPHLFTWSNDRKTWAMGSGCLPFYNHSDDPNCLKKGDLTSNTMTVIALRDIRAGEELTSRYYSKAWRQCFQSF